ncbi:hypothetical protein ABZX85_27800 [Streptomyces sp. NPDC004539]|uniref:hypothetical protein n=1 Tax=Streptomyces sp. NPDC004539 TaxID=3154280 RepID=UPI0033A8DC1C
MSSGGRADWYLSRTGPDDEPADRGPGLAAYDTPRRWRLRLTPHDDPYLLDHLVAGEPTLPGTFMLEIAAEATRRVIPGSVPTGFRDAEFTTFVRPPTARAHTEFTVHATQIVPHRVHVTLERRLLPRGDATRARHHTCFRTDVLIGTPGPPPTPHPPATDGAPVTDPYYRPDSPVLLRGVFHNTRDGRVTATHRTARWTPDLARADWLSHFTVPSLLLCATLRTAALPPGPHGEQTLYVPRHLGHIDLFTPGLGDTALTAHHGDGITLHGTADGEFRADAPDGTVLLEIRDARLAALGTV